jgi:Zn-dependent protease
MGAISILMCIFFGIAWGAMPVDRSRFRGKYADAFVSLAGPAMNLLIAFVTLTALAVWMHFAGNSPLSSDENLHRRLSLLLLSFGILNIALFLLNMIPVPPLDGSSILADFSRTYRDLVNRPEALGAASAILIGILIVGGPYLFRVADLATLHYVRFVGRLLG